MDTLETFKFLSQRKNEILDHKIQYLITQAENLCDVYTAVVDGYGLDSKQMETLHLATQPFINHLFDELRESETTRRGNTHD